MATPYFIEPQKTLNHNILATLLNNQPLVDYIIQQSLLQAALVTVA